MEGTIAIACLAVRCIEVAEGRWWVVLVTLWVIEVIGRLDIGDELAGWTESWWVGVMRRHLHC